MVSPPSSLTTCASQILSYRVFAMGGDLGVRPRSVHCAARSQYRDAATFAAPGAFGACRGAGKSSRMQGDDRVASGDGKTTPPAGLELWGGHECTVNRVGDRYFDQTVRTGHEHRIEDLARFAEM